MKDAQWFLIDYWFKSCSNSLKFEKISELSKNESPVSRTPGIWDSTGIRDTRSQNSPVSGTPGVKTPRYPGHRESKLPGIRDTRSQNFPVYGTPAKNDSPVSLKPGSRFSSFYTFFKLQVIDTDFKATTYQKIAYIYSLLYIVATRKITLNVVFAIVAIACDQLLHLAMFGQPS